jgi:hypothetical protein
MQGGFVVRQEKRSRNSCMVCARVCVASRGAIGSGFRHLGMAGNFASSSCRRRLEIPGGAPGCSRPAPCQCGAVQSPRKGLLLWVAFETGQGRTSRTGCPKDRKHSSKDRQPGHFQAHLGFGPDTHTGTQYIAPNPIGNLSRMWHQPYLYSVYLAPTVDSCCSIVSALLAPKGPPSSTFSLRITPFSTCHQVTQA